MNVYVSDFGFARLKPPTTSPSNGTNGGHGGVWVCNYVRVVCVWADCI